MRKPSLLIFIFVFFVSNELKSQFPSGSGNKTNQTQLNIGHFYGKVIDSISGRGIDGTTILLVGSKMDSITKKMKPYTFGSMVTAPKGEFSFESLPLFGNFQLIVTAVSYKADTFRVKFDMPDMQSSPTSGSNRMQSMLSIVEKDLGNLKLQPSGNTLADVTVTSSSKPFFEMGVDRKIFNVDKNIVSQGQTATEVMKQIPSLNVDIDGNVTLRNAAPQLFIDGRPTTLSLEQIPADIIEKVELITNPSAKYDASGGNAGILNIVLKKNRKTGYNGGLRAGVDSRFRLNLGGDLNYRMNKVNFFLTGFYNQRKSLSWFTTDRMNLVLPASSIKQDGSGINTGNFAFIRPGIDIFIDNRNTLSLGGNFTKGSFDNSQEQRIDSSISNQFISFSEAENLSKFNFTNLGGNLSFKHNFTRESTNITADVNYTSSTNNSQNNILTTTFFPDNTPKGLPFNQLINGEGYNRFLTIQTDYENKLSKNSKLEAGLRSATRFFKNINNQSFFDHEKQDFVLLPSVSTQYQFTDQVYAAYVNYTWQINKWNFQAGLRSESSDYNGKEFNRDSSFEIQFPISLFPSMFITYRLTDKEDIQLNYSRRINRPNFFQLIPFYDYSDPQNPSVGNPGLRPEFTGSYEVSYSNTYKKGANFLATAWYKRSTSLVTRYQYIDLNGGTPEPSDSVVFNSFANANSSSTYGLELTNRMVILKIWDVTASFNLFNSTINGDNLDQGFTNDLVSWFAKLNNNIKLKKGYSIQISGDYFARTVLPISSGSSGNSGGGRGGGGGFGGGMWGGMNLGTAQGYIKPRYSVDFAVRKEWTWKNGTTGSVSVSMNDIFRTQVQASFAESIFIQQNNLRRRDPQVLRINFSYRFGKFDTNLFKRKSNNAESGGGGMEMIGGG
jgi:outer membrane receptor protein involved in Fe transport